MILQPIIDATLSVISRNGVLSQPLTDFLRPLFLKEDPADGARTFNAFLQQPGAKNSQRLVKTILRRELEDRPEAVHKLENLLEKEGITLQDTVPAQTEGGND